MATIRKRLFVRWVIDGRQVPAKTPGAQKVSETSAHYYAFGLDKRPIKLSFDRRASQKMLDDMILDRERGRAGLPAAPAPIEQLETYLTRFESDVRAGLASRSKKRTIPSDRQVAQTMTRIRETFLALGIVSVFDLDERTPNRLSTWLRESVRSNTRSAQTAEFYLASVRRFVWWLSQQRVSVPGNLLDEIPGFEASSHRTLTRGALSIDELRKLLESARCSTKSYRYLDGLEASCRTGLCGQF